MEKEQLKSTLAKQEVIYPWDLMQASSLLPFFPLFL